MRFSKMHGIGNDFIVTHHVKPENVEMLAALAPRLCDRRKGIGADGVILILPSESADCRMRIFNADGSEAEMCGNGIRCLVRYLERGGRALKAMLTVETGAGLISTTCLDDRVRVDMGAPVLDAGRIPTTRATGRVVMEPLAVAGTILHITAVSMGNPHAVTFVDEISDETVHRIGAELERHAFFPKRVNAEFVRVISPTEIQMRVYERGCGETMACGTGACASVVAGILCGTLHNAVRVHLLGGDLDIEWDGHEDHSVLLTGPASWVFDGEVEMEPVDLSRRS